MRVDFWMFPSSICRFPQSDRVSGYTLTRQATEHLQKFTLILHEGGPRILRSILVFALPEEYRDRFFFWEIKPGVIIELTLEVAKNTGHFNDEIDFAGSECLECRKVDNVVCNSSSLLVTVNSCWLQADCGILFAWPYPSFEASGVLRRWPTVALRDELFWVRTLQGCGP